MRGGRALRPCPRCMVPSSKLDLMGYVRDITFRQTGARKYLADLVARSREFIYQMGYGIGSAAVDGLLKSTSSVPTEVSRVLSNKHDVVDQYLFKECVCHAIGRRLQCTSHAGCRLHA